MINRKTTILLCFLFISCVPKIDTIPVKEVGIREETGFASLGIESKDIDIISQKIVENLITSDFLQNKEKVPIVILEGKYFSNESSYIINSNLLADRMRINLIMRAKGKIQFVTRQNLEAIIEEAQTSGRDIDIVGAQYRMTARIASIHKITDKVGVQSNYFQFSFELLDLENSTIVWANIYDIKKIGKDDSIYR